MRQQDLLDHRQDDALTVLAGGVERREELGLNLGGETGARVGDGKKTSAAAAIPADDDLARGISFSCRAKGVATGAVGAVRV